MPTIIVDALLQDKLKNLTETTLLVDEKGAPLGHFVPGTRFDSSLYRLAESQCPYTPQQLQRMRSETGGKSLGQIWQSVGQLPSSRP